MFFNKYKKLFKEAEIQLEEKQNNLNGAVVEIDNLKKEISEKNSQITKLNSDLNNCLKNNEETVNKYSSIIDKDKYLETKREEINVTESCLKELNSKYQNSLKIHSDLLKEISLFKDTLEIGSFGLYEPQFSFETSEEYKSKIENNYEKQKQLIKNDKAAICHTEWTVGGSKTEGRKMTNQYKKLMLYAFNGECDGLIAKVKWNNAEKTKERIIKAFESINKLGVTQNVELTNDYLNLKGTSKNPSFFRLDFESSLF